MCGEKDRVLRERGPLVGSPPRVRGKVIFNSKSCRTHWITPACAGKSAPRHTPLSAEEGSPPRVRGKAEKADIRYFPPRITPACAGKSLFIDFVGSTW